jgi:hypothetical protein
MIKNSGIFVYNINVKRKGKKNSTSRPYMLCIREKDNTDQGKAREGYDIRSPVIRQKGRHI